MSENDNGKPPIWFHLLMAAIVILAFTQFFECIIWLVEHVRVV